MFPHRAVVTFVQSLFAVPLETHLQPCSIHRLVLHVPGQCVTVGAVQSEGVLRGVMSVVSGLKCSCHFMALVIV